MKTVNRILQPVQLAVRRVHGTPPRRLRHVRLVRPAGMRIPTERAGVSVIYSFSHTFDKKCKNVQIKIKKT